MRKAVLGLMLAACGDNAKLTDVPADAAVDALLTGRDDPCVSRAGGAAITAAHLGLQPRYERMYAGGVFSTDVFAFKAFFTNEVLVKTGDVIDCMLGGPPCTTTAFVVEVLVTNGAELGVHPADIHNTASTWQASGTVELTDLVYPVADNVGHVAGSIQVDSASPPVTITGTFDDAFCLGLVEATLP